MEKRTKQIVVFSVLGVLALIVIVVNSGILSADPTAPPEVSEAAVQQVEQAQKTLPPELPATPKPNEAPVTTRGSRQ